MYIFFTFVICAIVFFIKRYIEFVHSRRNLYKYASKIPGPPSFPIIGSAHLFAGKSNDGIFETFKYISTFGSEDGIVKMWLGPKLFVMLSNPNWLEIVAKSELAKEDDAYKFLKPYISNSIFVNPVPAWKQRRKMLSPAFDKKHIDSYFDKFLGHTKIMIDIMSVNIDKKQFDVFEYIKLCTMDIISATTLQFNSNYQRGENSEITKLHVIGMDIVMHRILKFWLHIDWIFKLSEYGKIQKKLMETAEKYCNTIVKNKISMNSAEKNSIEFQGEDSVQKSYIDILIENSKDANVLNKADRNGEILAVSVAGSDTTSTEVGFALMFLGTYPHIQEKVFNELNEIFENSNRPLTLDDLPKMKFLECVIKETMRLFPTVPIVLRRVMRDVDLGKYILPAGCGCGIFMYQVHRNKNIWGPNADEFDPDRFLPENSTNRHPFAFIPFSGGSRDCIGKRYAMASMKIMLCEILRTYKIYSNFDYHNIRLCVGISVKPVDGYFISIKSRD